MNRFSKLNSRNNFESTNKFSRLFLEVVFG